MLEDLKNYLKKNIIFSILFFKDIMVSSTYIRYYIQQAIIIQYLSLYTIAIYEMFIKKNNLSIGKFDLLETVKDERTQLLSCLNS